MTSDNEEDEAGIFTTSTSDDPHYSAVFEDDGEVAYGYMVIDKKIVSDVWLYNAAKRQSRLHGVIARKRHSVIQVTSRVRAALSRLGMRTRSHFNGYTGLR